MEVFNKELSKEYGLNMNKNTVIIGLVIYRLPYFNIINIIDYF